MIRRPPRSTLSSSSAASDVYKRQALDRSLGHKDAIEGILVCCWQVVDVDGVFAGDGQFGVAVIQQSAAQQPRIHPEVLSSEAAFDGIISHMLAALKSNSFPK